MIISVQDFKPLAEHTYTGKHKKKHLSPSNTPVTSKVGKMSNNTLHSFQTTKPTKNISF